MGEGKDGDEKEECSKEDEHSLRARIVLLFVTCLVAVAFINPVKMADTGLDRAVGAVNMALGLLFGAIIMALVGEINDRE